MSIHKNSFEMYEDNAGGMHLIVLDACGVPLAAFCNIQYWAYEDVRAVLDSIDSLPGILSGIWQNCSNPGELATIYSDLVATIYRELREDPATKLIPWNI